MMAIVKVRQEQKWTFFYEKRKAAKAPTVRNGMPPFVGDTSIDVVECDQEDDEVGPHIEEERR